MNERIFNQKTNLLTSLLEKIKSHLYWGLKARYVLFDFDYLTWRLNPLMRLKGVS